MCVSERQNKSGLLLKTFLRFFHHHHIPYFTLLLFSFCSCGSYNLVLWHATTIISYRTEQSSHLCLCVLCWTGLLVSRFSSSSCGSTEALLVCFFLILSQDSSIKAGAVRLARHHHHNHHDHHHHIPIVRSHSQQHTHKTRIQFEWGRQPQQAVLLTKRKLY